jgi:hypothetical protein
VSTFGELADSTLLHLSGFTTVQDQATHLIGDVTASAVVLPVADATALSRGLLEIGDELLWADSVDTSASQANLPPYGRGYRSSTAAAHAAGTRVVAAPLFPRVLVKRALNETILAVYPYLFAVKETSITYLPGVYTYELPADAGTIVSIKWQDVTAASDWVDIRRWSIDTKAATAPFTTGKSLTIADSVLPGRTVRVVYAAQPTQLATDADVFSTVTGLPGSCEDVIRLGAAQRMIPFLDAPHLSGASAEADFSSNMRPAGGAADLGKFLLQNFQFRLDQESLKLQGQFPVRVRYTN